MGVNAIRSKPINRQLVENTNDSYINFLPGEIRQSIFLYVPVCMRIDLRMVCKLWLKDISNDPRQFAIIVIDQCNSVTLLQHQIVNRNVTLLKLNCVLTIFDLQILTRSLMDRKDSVFVELNIHDTNWEIYDINKHIAMFRTIQKILLVFRSNVRTIEIDLYNGGNVIDFINACNGIDISINTNIDISMLTHGDNTQILEPIFKRFPKLNKLRLIDRGFERTRSIWLFLQTLECLELTSSYEYRIDLIGLPVLKKVKSLTIRKLTIRDTPKNDYPDTLDFLESFHTLNHFKTIDLCLKKFDQTRFFSFIEKLDTLECEFEYVDHEALLRILLLTSKMPKTLIITGTFLSELRGIARDYGAELRDKFPGSRLCARESGFTLIQTTESNTNK